MLAFVLRTPTRCKSLVWKINPSLKSLRPKIHFNPLTPVPPITVCDEPWPFFHFWRHHFWRKLASSTCILNFCRRKRSFQWCPGQSDRPSGALDMHKNAQKVEWKSQSKISCHYTWLLHAKICLSRRRFLRSFLTASKPSRRSITVAKRKEKEKKGQKKVPKIKKPKDVGHFLIQNYLFSAHARVTMWQNTVLVARKASCCVANAFSIGLKLIWPRSSLKAPKCPKKRIFCQKFWESMGYTKTYPYRSWWYMYLNNIVP